MRSTQQVIAICSCGAHFYIDGIDRMNNHINDQNYLVHQWVEVPDVKMVEEPRKCIPL